MSEQLYTVVYKNKLVTGHTKGRKAQGKMGTGVTVRLARKTICRN